MSKEIEEIKKGLEAHKCYKCYMGNNREYYLKTLVNPVLSLLEKEKEQSDYFRLEVNRLTDELAKAKKEEKMTLREFLTKVLERNRKMEAKAKEEGYYASALKKQGAIDEVGVILLELSTSILLDKEI